MRSRTAFLSFVSASSRNAVARVAPSAKNSPLKGYDFIDRLFHNPLISNFSRPHDWAAYIPTTRNPRGKVPRSGTERTRPVRAIASRFCSVHESGRRGIAEIRSDSGTATLRTFPAIFFVSGLPILSAGRRRKILPGKSEALPCRNRTGFRRFLDGPIRVLSRNGLRSLGPDESSVPDREPSRAGCALSGYMRPESCGRLKFEIKGLWKRRSMKS